MKIKLIDYGIAFRIGDIIYINKEIKKNEELYSSLIKHEKEHSNGYEIKDLIIDLKGKHLKNIKKDYYKFILTHPKSWFQFLPITYFDKEIQIDITMSIIWLFIFTIIFIVFMGVVYGV